VLDVLRRGSADTNRIVAGLAKEEEKSGRSCIPIWARTNLHCTANSKRFSTLLNPIEAVAAPEAEQRHRNEHRSK
jgi:hypothetical protein